MSLTIKSEGDFEALAVGQYEGVCYRIVDMGTRMEPPFKEGDKPKKRTTHNELTAFDMDVYCDEFNGNSSDKTKAMCDIFDTLPEWQQKDIEDSFELKAAKKDSNASVEEAVVVEEESNGLADFQAEDDNDSVPF